MRAILRWNWILLAGGLWLLPASALAQNAPEPATASAPAPNIVGPRELQNFSLPRTASKAATQPSTAPATATPPPPRTDTTASDVTPAPAPARRIASSHRAVRQTATVALPPPPSAQAAPSTASLPPPTPSPIVSAPQPAIDPGTPAQVTAPAATLAPEHKLSILPWLIAALALAGGTLFLLWLRRPREALVGGPQFDPFTTPEPAPEPAPIPAPAPRAPAPPQPKPAAPAPMGIVAARLRPALEIEMRPLRCIVEDSQVTIEFEIELFNAGTAPARAILAEATLLNASAAQGQELAAFFSSPAGIGQRMDAIAPMRRVTIASQVAAPRSAIEEYELAGRKAFVPVIAFNALYEWSGGKGQSSVAYLVGRDTRRDKLGPLRLDGASREIRGLAARPLPSGVRS